MTDTPPPPNHVSRFALLAGAVAVAVATGQVLEARWFTSGLGWMVALLFFGGYLLVFGPAITIASAGTRDPAVMARARWVVPVCVAVGTAASLGLDTAVPVVVAAVVAAIANWLLVDRG